LTTENPAKGGQQSGDEEKKGLLSWGTR